MAASRPAPSGTGWPASIMRHDPQRPAVAVACHRDAAKASGRQLQTVEIKAFRDFGHGARGFAGGEQNEPAFGRWRQQRRQAGRGVCRGYRSAKQVREKCAQGGVHSSNPSCPAAQKSAYNSSNELSVVSSHCRLSASHLRHAAIAADAPTNAETSANHNGYPLGGTNGSDFTHSKRQGGDGRG